MNKRRIISAQTTINIAVILRLLFTAVLAYMLARAYSDESENLFRLYQGSRHLIIIIAGFFIDTILTILWLYRPKIHKLHFWLYFFLGSILYAVYSIDLINTSGIGVAIAIAFTTPFIWLIGLIPFAMCISGKERAKVDQFLKDKYDLLLTEVEQNPEA